MTRAISWSASESVVKCARSAGVSGEIMESKPPPGEVEGCSAAAGAFLIINQRFSAADAVRRVPIAAAITSHLDGVLLCSAWRRRSAASSSGVHRDGMLWCF